MLRLPKGMNASLSTAPIARFRERRMVKPEPMIKFAERDAHNYRKVYGTP